MLGKRLPIRLRAALAAALTAALAFTAGALWLRNEVYASKMADTRNRARASLDVIEQRYKSGNGSAQALFQSPDTWVIVDPKGRFVEGDPDLKPFVPAPLYGLPDRTGPTVPIEQDLHLGAVGRDAGPGSRQLDGRELRVVTSAFHAPGLLDGRPTAPVENLTLHILVTPQDAEEAVATVDHVLYAGLPAAVLLVALIVWATTSRALRPVEDIQQRLRAITSRDLSLRVPVPPRHDEIARLAATTNDTLDRLEQAAEQQRRFTADASHELRTPLAALRADLEVALHYPDTTNWPDVIRDTLGDAERLEQLTEDLLLLADLDNHTLPTVHPVELGALAQKAVAQARRHAPTSLQIDCPTSDHITLHGDARQLERLLRNLLDNAVRHARSHVLVTVSAHAATALIEVRDDGPGIPAEHRERIFERFTRLDASRNRTSGGTGLGLAIAREIVHHHRGALTLSDPQPTTGAHFVATLPLTPDTATTPETAAGTPGQRSSTG
ncbi:MULTISPECIES: HAMP domain-containing sensor histidine kinase [unclassified Streptomyces]|uniref:sensor histidine kinase n=1 Tax=unclassified Streptomyces TaxID=2593676 RepID=UPI0003737F9C|nr:MULTISPECIES: HAMP domain-containing sensor histidine kinase [unclassified Streptomyces]MYT28265.1 HAMP domain-containing protein [Streptomyces sp. SID8354]